MALALSLLLSLSPARVVWACDYDSVFLSMRCVFAREGGRERQKKREGGWCVRECVCVCLCVCVCVCDLLGGVAVRLIVSPDVLCCA